MTRGDLARLKELREAMTPAPWRRSEVEPGEVVGVLYCSAEVSGDEPRMEVRDLDAIVAAINHLDDLIRAGGEAGRGELGRDR